MESKVINFIIITEFIGVLHTGGMNTIKVIVSSDKLIKMVNFRIKIHFKLIYSWVNSIPWNDSEFVISGFRVNACTLRNCAH